MKLLLSAAAVTLGLACASCLKEGTAACVTTTTEPIIKVTGPRKGMVNQAATFSCEYPMQNACGQYNGLTEDPLSNNLRYISVQVRYEGCTCPQTASTAKATYTVLPTRTGTYYLKFATLNGYITDTLDVQ